MEQVELQTREGEGVAAAAQVEQVAQALSALDFYWRMC
jgi:hypothetical protein